MRAAEEALPEVEELAGLEIWAAATVYALAVGLDVAGVGHGRAVTRGATGGVCRGLADGVVRSAYVVVRLAAVAVAVDCGRDCRQPWNERRTNSKNCFPR